MDALKHDLRLQKANELVVAEAKVGEAPKKEEEAAEKKPRRRPARRRPRRPLRRRACGEAQAHPQEEDRGDCRGAQGGVKSISTRAALSRPGRIRCAGETGARRSRQERNHFPARRAYFGITVLKRSNSHEFSSLCSRADQPGRAVL